VKIRGVPKQVIGPVIAKRRHVLGLSQEELAVRVGVSRDSVSSWERGKHFPHRHLGKLEQVLGVDLSGGAAPDRLAPPATISVMRASSSGVGSVGGLA
jgi:transcriptional regulator with XRE-family HTH domain